MTDKTHRECFVSAADGVRLYYRDYGDRYAGKTPVLCLSGLTRNSKDFHALAKRLCPERRVLTLDYRGRGKSDNDPNWQNYQPSTYVGDVRNLLSALNIHRVFVVGTSLGGIVAMGMGAAIPGMLAGALLNDVGPDISMKGLDVIRRYMEAETAFPDWRSVADHLSLYFPDLGFKSKEEWEFLATLSYREREDGMIVREWDRNLVKPLQDFDASAIDLWPYFRSLGRLPLVTLRGEKSNILTPQTLRRMKDEIPAMISVTVPDVGHAPSLSEPQSLAALDGVLHNVDSAVHS